MPNINDINGVTVANLAKLDAVLKANISKVNGLTLSAAAAFLLDTYTGAAAAYSTRKLKTGVTVAARIRRSGDDIEADVEFDSNNEISLTSPISNASSGTYTDLADFVDHSTTPRDAFVDEWKDQSGSGNHAAQATAASQPKLYDATTGLITENGKPAIQSDDTPDNLLMGSSVTLHSGFFVYRKTADKTLSTLVGGSGTQVDGGGTTANFQKAISVQEATNITQSTTAADNTSQFLGSVHLGTTSTARINGTQEGTGVSGTISVAAIFQRTDLLGNSALVFVGRMQEIILYDSAQSGTDISGIETDINSDYLIYQPTDAPTSGLLATYTGAAAAYSVRQLSDKAVIALRIRRDSDDEEKNIGFDSNGDLATADISAFCGTANGYVTRWWDQSTNGNHADQATDTSQPKIYDATTGLIEEGSTGNEKPAIELGRSPLKQLTTSAISWSTSFTAATVLQPTDDGNFYIKNWSIGTDGTSGGYSHIAFMGATAADWQINDSAMFGDGYLGDPRIITTGSAFTSGSQALSFLSLNSTAATLHVDGSEPTYRVQTTGNTSAASNILYINGRHTTTQGQGMDGTIQELILWASDQSSNRTGIQNNINSYFSIYT